MLSFATALLSAAVLAQAPDQPPDAVPAGAKREVLDLRYEVQDLKPKTEQLQMKETELAVQIDLPADVLFDFDKATLRPAAQQALTDAANVVRTKAKGTVRISGYTDGKGAKAYNQKLSEKRALAVRDFLVKEAGLRGVAFDTHGFGADKPVAPNTKPDGSDNPEGRQQNRRVEILIRKR